jgi:hypothetical protein
MMRLKWVGLLLLATLVTFFLPVLMVIGLAIGGVIMLITVTTRSFQPVRNDDVIAFHHVHDLKPSSESGQMVADYLRRARRNRMKGALLFGIPVLAIETLVFNTTPVDFWTPLFAGYLIGAVVVELHDLRTRNHTTGTATLEPRTVEKFATTNEHLYGRVAAVITITAALVQLSMSDNDNETAITIIGSMIVALAVMELVPRAIALRARRLVDPTLRDTDDAIRTVGINSIRTAGLGLIVLLTTWQFSNLYYDAPELKQVLGPVAVALFAVEIAVLVSAGRFLWPKMKPAEASE